MGLLGHMVALFLIFQGNSKLFYIGDIVDSVPDHHNKAVSQ